MPVGGPGGIQTASGAPTAAMFGGDPQLAAIYSGMLDARDVKGALGLATDYATREPKEPKAPEVEGGMFWDGDSFERVPGWLEQQLQLKKAGAAVTNVTTNVGGDNKADAKLREELSKKEGERWSALQESGTVAAGLQQDMEALDQLINVVPSGPVEG
jgi:hypothetical protein